MSLNKREKLFGEFGDMDHSDVLSIAQGDIPEEFAGLDIADLGAIESEDDFEQPGLHKRARAGISAVIGRSLDNVSVDYWGTDVLTLDSQYLDYDRIVQGHLVTTGSTWGSKRAASVRHSRTTHVTNNGSIGRHAEYTPEDYMVALLTDSEGAPRTIARLAVRNFATYAYPDDKSPVCLTKSKSLSEMHPQVRGLYLDVGRRIDDVIIQQAFEPARQ